MPLADRRPRSPGRPRRLGVDPRHDWPESTLLAAPDPDSLHDLATQRSGRYAIGTYWTDQVGTLVPDRIEEFRVDSSGNLMTTGGNETYDLTYALVDGRYRVTAIVETQHAALDGCYYTWPPGNGYIDDVVYNEKTAGKKDRIRDEGSWFVHRREDGKLYPVTRSILRRRP